MKHSSSSTCTTHRVWEAGRAVHVDKTPEYDRWSREQYRRIEAGQVDHVLQALRFLKPTGKTAKEKVEELITYFTNNRDRMDYPSYRAQGLRDTSSTVESANYHVTAARLKLQGMRWSEKGAAQMARHRADLFNAVWKKGTRQVLAAWSHSWEPRPLRTAVTVLATSKTRGMTYRLAQVAHPDAEPFRDSMSIEPRGARQTRKSEKFRGDP